MLIPLQVHRHRVAKGERRGVRDGEVTTTIATAINRPIMRVKEMEGKIERERERERECVAVLPCFPLCRMTSGCCLSNWLGLPPIRAQTGKVPLGYTQPQKQEAGREGDRERKERERVQCRHRLDCATEAFLHGIWEMFLLKGNCSSSVCCREARCIPVHLQWFRLIHWPGL